MWRTGLVLLQRSQGMDLCPGIYTYVSIRDGYMCLGQVIGIHVCILQMLNFYLYERNISLQFQNIAYGAFKYHTEEKQMLSLGEIKCYVCCTYKLRKCRRESNYLSSEIPGKTLGKLYKA